MADSIKTLPVPPSITASNMISAAIYDDHYQQKRIETWGALNRKFLRDLIVPAK